ncbi:hypothetical protein P691DRAFT_757705 [Macrolepiota fuliginosa MF-IS2]|uniref:RlpA-like protein double-psi beta-barrel domain-containing protein n=1 Tax=Macrolepiota fuliginosa MF-IS2 TaxID=1400762 RepID=A0A9P6C6M6_9AGAR|nr:hypothetical protein P691DRAFT_757705 [Macrolepiota fuliginosa MF-IS2]
MQPSTALFALVFTYVSLFSSVAAFKGDATYYYPGLGACGHTNKGSDLVAALPTAKYGHGDHCGKKIGIHYGGKYVQATVVDLCPGCAPNDIDVSPSTFSHLANKALGRIKVDWQFL